MATDALDPQPVLRVLHERVVAHIIGGVAVAAHGYPRPTIDLDVVPDPDPGNLKRLAEALGELHAVPAEGDEFAAAEFRDVHSLAAGGNFRLETDLGPLDVMQWIAGIDSDNLYAELASSAIGFTLDDIPLRCCGLGHLRAMKKAAARPRDLDDLAHLPS